MRNLLFTAAFLTVSTLTFAQAPLPQDAPAAQQRHVANPHKAAMKISKELNLSPDQESRLEPILADRQQKLAAVRANNALSDTDRKQQTRAIHQASMSQMKEVLSPDQMKQLRVIHRDREAANTPTSL